jgi:hypothetical protein
VFYFCENDQKAVATERFGRKDGEGYGCRYRPAEVVVKRNGNAVEPSWRAHSLKLKILNGRDEPWLAKCSTPGLK